MSVILSFSIVFFIVIENEQNKASYKLGSSNSLFIRLINKFVVPMRRSKSNSLLVLNYEPHYLHNIR